MIRTNFRNQQEAQLPLTYPDWPSPCTCPRSPTRKGHGKIFGLQPRLQAGMGS